MFHRETFSVWIGLILLLGWSSCRRLVEEKRLAVQKCEEYRKIAIRKQTFLSLTLFPTSIQFDSNNCSTEVQPILKGEVAKYGEFPHHALLGYPKKGGGKGYVFICEGTLISDQHVMTAAHCLKQLIPTVVRLGEYDTTFITGEEYEVDIIDTRRHPKLKFPRWYHDIGLVKLAERIMFTKLIRPACLWDTEERNITRYIEAGFAGIDFFGPMSTQLKKVQLQEFSSKECSDRFNTSRKLNNGIIDGQLCIRGLVDDFDICRGYSGSPLLTVTNKDTCMYHVIGIASAGQPCDTVGALAVFTKVSYYIDWIEDNVWGPNAL